MAERGTGGRTGDGPGDPGGRQFELHSVVVSYEDGPDRCTLYPRRDRCVERTSEWLSADLCAFVSLAEIR
jgi:hypothetical protein